MAEEPTGEVSEGGEEGDAVAKKKGFTSYLLILLPLLLVGIAGGGWVAFSYYPKLAQAAEALVGDDNQTAPDKAEPIEYGQFKELQGLIINPTNTEGRFLMVNIGLETAEPGVLEELNQKEIVVRDTILRLMSERSIAELSDISRRDSIKQGLIEALNTIIQNGQIDRIYFTQYVLQ